MYKKAQAAMEFLMTYGWAILVVLVAIGALAYFGVLNPSRFLPESCTVGPGIGCDDFKVNAGGTATVVLRNGMGVELDAVTISLQSIAGTGCTAQDNWGSGSTLTCTFSGLTTGSVGGRYSQSLNVSYTESGSTLSHSKIGTITTKYE